LWTKKQTQVLQGGFPRSPRILHRFPPILRSLGRKRLILREKARPLAKRRPRLLRHDLPGAVLLQLGRRGSGQAATAHAEFPDRLPTLHDAGHARPRRYVRLYDNEGRMTSEQYPAWGNGGTSSGPNMAFAYNSMGQPYSALDQNNGGQGVASASYNAAGQLLSMTSAAPCCYLSAVCGPIVHLQLDGAAHGDERREHQPAVQLLGDSEQRKDYFAVGHDQRRASELHL
jgi:hypothetical protein